MKLSEKSLKRTMAREITAERNGDEVHLLGWVHEIRDLGSIVFILLRDASGFCQITAKRSELSEVTKKALDDATGESVVYATGRVAAEPKARLGVEVKLQGLRILGKAVQPLPYDVTGKVGAGLETRLRHRILDLRKPENRAVFTLASSVTRAIREFFYDHGFVEVRTPRLIGTATEGGASLFEVKYFDRVAYLAQSPQLYKEELTSVFERVFEIGPFFRAEESHTGRHVGEFTSVDIEAAFADVEDVMELVEELIGRTYEWLDGNSRTELQAAGVSLRKPRQPFRRYTYDELVEELKGLGAAMKWGEDFSTPHLRALAKKRPSYYFITDFPTESKPFYIKPREDNPRMSESFDLMYQWLELASGGTRISDKALLTKRLSEQGLNPEMFRYHLETYDYGMPPHAGWGLGLDRLMMVLTRRTNIRETILFPRDKFRLFP